MVLTVQLKLQQMLLTASTLPLLHGRVFIVEIMGHKVGWLTLYAGIAGGADVYYCRKFLYDINKVVDSLYLRTGQGKRFFCILAVTEGALSKKEAEMSQKNSKQVVQICLSFCFLS